MHLCWCPQCTNCCLPREYRLPLATWIYGSILFCVFLIGWGCAFLWGPIADRFGRVRALIFAILCYSLFTFLGCIAQNIWQLGVFRFLAGFGVGGEFVGAAVFVAEELPSGRRVSGAGYLNSG